MPTWGCLLKRKTHLTLLIVILTAIGLSSFLYKWLVVGIPLQPSHTKQIWVVDARINLRADDTPVKMNFIIPQHPPGFAILDESFISRHYGLAFNQNKDNRESVWSTRRGKGLHSLFYRIMVYTSDQEQKYRLKPATTITQPEFNEKQHAAATAILKDIRDQSADIETFTAATIKLVNQDKNTNLDILLDRKLSRMSRAKVIIELLSMANIHARVVQGINLEASSTQTSLIPWLMVHDGKQWLYFNPETAEKTLPNNFLIWSYNAKPIITVKGAKLEQVVFSVSENTESVLQLLAHRREKGTSAFLDFSLSNLPIPTQELYKVLL